MRRSGEMAQGGLVEVEAMPLASFLYKPLFSGPDISCLSILKILPAGEAELGSNYLRSVLCLFHAFVSSYIFVALRISGMSEFLFHLFHKAVELMMVIFVRQVDVRKIAIILSNHDRDQSFDPPLTVGVNWPRLTE